MKSRHEVDGHAQELRCAQRGRREESGVGAVDEAGDALVREQRPDEQEQAEPRVEAAVGSDKELLEPGEAEVERRSQDEQEGDGEVLLSEFINPRNTTSPL